MPTLALTDFNIVCATLGGFISLFGLVSYLFKEKLYLSEALISLISGILFSPNFANLLRPLDYAQGSPAAVEAITLYFSRLVLGVQLVLAGVQLPSRYLLKEWKSLCLLLGPGMLAMWLCSSLVIFVLVPHLPFLHALAIAACITPTDPVLSNSIVKGRFADRNVPRGLQRIIIAESGANDGLGYPFLFFAIYLIQFVGIGGNDGGGVGEGQFEGGVTRAIALWFGETWGYTIVLSVVYGAMVGWLAKELLHWAEEKKYIDRESFLIFAIALALFIVGTCGMIGSDDVLACFIAGNVFTIDDWFRLETLDDSLQPTIDMLLNLFVFMWFGAVCPWGKFLQNDIIPIHRLVFLGILILVFRRIPIIFVMHKYIRQIEQLQQAAFVGFFGPIGVSAIFYLYISREYLGRWVVPDGSGRVREDAVALSEEIEVIVWFLVVCSIIVHGLSISLAKLGIHLSRTLSTALSYHSNPDRDNNYSSRLSRTFLPSLTSSTSADSRNRHHADPPRRALFRIGRSFIPERDVEIEVEEAESLLGVKATAEVENDTIAEERDLEREVENGQGTMQGRAHVQPGSTSLPVSAHGYVASDGNTSDKIGSSMGESSSSGSSYLKRDIGNGRHLQSYGATAEVLPARARDWARGGH
ncbi:hypothetical protein GX50_04206 [[Emmonsia] crescens]|uniref:Cation/H+ exchanger transmembrane domain-containing protein n=1 Tax=[Emmonsia] crescens TaxID=73230 RepID=A0A2B7ZHY5_9EURO|nr:hypothetical protein GX50_04206 [Emmonsia crescens]